MSSLNHFTFKKESVRLEARDGPFLAFSCLFITTGMELAFPIATFRSTTQAASRPLAGKSLGANEAISVEEFLEAERLETLRVTNLSIKS